MIALLSNLPDHVVGFIALGQVTAIDLTIERANQVKSTIDSAFLLADGVPAVRWSA
jgi:hypothetical protein